MYQLIIGAIAVVIFTALTLLIWLGGHQWIDATLRAELIAVSQQEQQISGALTLYRQENLGSSIGTDAVLLAQLHLGGYLRDVPPGAWSVSPDGRRMSRQLDGQTAASCARMNALVGAGAVCPPCDSDADKSVPICQQP
ncbi:hypothetical protein [Rhizobium leguminosarum]|uniref:hypothetical protein n=1 Tax=Rhizobium leguminosarum TaxID=384 RepID=UPI00103099D0|nr:hypothetical protein [Rhizobium leguminosarum]TAV90458.1 hypothetical protein ELI22_15040 [Rhizobium leguminosarum]TAV95063.1 hypothetical protein ELI21_15195 [Rhizobium leguminosarum]TAW36141.1 hypothetical protein ELI23_15240 [Rhizobium leguminosarum]